MANANVFRYAIKKTEKKTAILVIWVMNTMCWHKLKNEGVYFECMGDRERILWMRFYDATVKLCSDDDRWENYGLHRFGYCTWSAHWRVWVKKQLSDAILKENSKDWIGLMLIEAYVGRIAKTLIWPNAKVQSIIPLSRGRTRDRAAIITASKMIFKNNFSSSVEVSFISVQCKQSMDMVRFCVTQTISRSVCVSVFVHGRIVLMLTDKELLIGYSFSFVSSLIHHFHRAHFNFMNKYFPAICLLLCSN